MAEAWHGHTSPYSPSICHSYHARIVRFHRWISRSINPLFSSNIRIYLYSHCNSIKNFNILIDSNSYDSSKIDNHSVLITSHSSKLVIMIRTKQRTSTNSQRSSTSSFASQSEIVSMKKSATMNKASDTFSTQTIEAFETSNYAALQRELDQLNEKRRRVELLREMQKIKAVKIAEFSEVVFATTTNRSDIDDLQKKKLFKIVNLKKYKNITQHDLNIFIRECNEMFEIRRNIYANDKNKILFAKSFLDDVSAKD